VTRGADNAWAVILPIEAAADQGSVEAAASQVTVMQILDHLPDIAPKDVGLDDPEYKLAVKFTSGVERNVEIGVIISKDSVDSLLELLSNPPYMPTETPPPPTPEAVSP